MKKLVLMLLSALPLSGQPTRNTVPQPPANQLEASAINHVYSADQFPGSDIGARFNAAIAAACPAGYVACKVTVAPGNYTQTTTIVVPNSVGNGTGSGGFVELDFNGSTLTWTGRGDAIQIASQPGNQPTGAIRNLYLFNGPRNTSSVNAIHQFARAAFQYERVSITGFNNTPDSAGIFLDNTTIGASPYFTERTYMNRVTTDDTSKGIRLLGTVHGGTGSFGYTTILSGECGIGDGQICLSVEGNGSFESADMYSSFIEIKGNSLFRSKAGRFVSVTNGADIRTSFVNIVGETQGGLSGYLFFVDANNSFISAVGNTFGAGNASGLLSRYTAGTSSTLQVPQMNDAFTLQGAFTQYGTAQSRHSKLAWDGRNLRFGMVNDGDADKSGFFQLYGRMTANNDPEVDATPAITNRQFNLAYCDAYGTPGVLLRGGGCGFGPGYGDAPNAGGTVKPILPLEATAMGVRNPTATAATTASGGAVLWTQVDAAGNVATTLRSGKAGNPSNHVYLNFFDYKSSAYLTGQDCYSNTQVFCSFPNLTAQRFFQNPAAAAPPSSTAPCTAGQFVDAPLNGTYFHFFCYAENRWARVAMTTSAW